MPGQGNPGGYGTASYNPNYGHYYTAGGGGGAGGNGGNSARSPWPGPIWPSYPNHPNWNSTAGNGGTGKPVPAFAGPLLLGMVPESAFPASVLVDTYGNGVGPTGRIGGGGGGGLLPPFHSVEQVMEVQVAEDMVLMYVPDSIILHLSNLDHQYLVQIPIMLRMEFNI